MILRVLPFIDLDCGLGLTPDQAEQIAFLLYDGAIFDEVFRAENKYGGNIADRSIISGIMQYRGYDLFGRNLFYNGESCYDLRDENQGRSRWRGYFVCNPFDVDVVDAFFKNRRCDAISIVFCCSISR